MGVKRKHSVTGNKQPTNDNFYNHQPHDKFVKCAFKNKGIAIDFFVAHLVEKNLSKQDLEEFSIGSNEHQQPLKQRLAEDIVYCGKIQGQNYYIIVEHQSMMLERLNEYVLSLHKVHAAQGFLGRPVVIPIVLYHETAVNRKKNSGKQQKWGYLSRISDYFDTLEARNHLSLNFEYKLVDLTVMQDLEIKNHGNAAIVEWILQDSSLPGDEFLQKSKEHLRVPNYTTMTKDSKFDEFHVALAEYILSVYDDDKSLQGVIDELDGIVPLEKETMGKLAEKIKYGGRLEGKLETAKNMLKKGMNGEAIKEFTGLSDEELSPALLKKDSDINPELESSEIGRNAASVIQGASGLTESEIGFSSECIPRTVDKHILKTTSSNYQKLG